MYTARNHIGTSASTEPCWIISKLTPNLRNTNAIAAQASTSGTTGPINRRRAPREPGAIRLARAAGRFPGSGIRVAAHQEEQRHHLEQQREPLHPRLHGEHVVELQLTVANPRRRDQPVPGDHGADRGRTQEVHVTVAEGGVCAARLRARDQGDTGTPL